MTLPPADPPAAARRHAAIILAAAAALALGFALLAERLGPPVGDLTRISGRSERAFGWRGESHIFAAPQYRAVTPDELLSGRTPAQIVVFGDSFSIPRQTSATWIDHLAQRTGLATAFVRIGDFRPALAYLRSQAFRNAPPQAVIVESVERELLARARALAAEGDCAPPPAPQAARGLAPRPAELRPLGRRVAFDSFDERMSWGALAARKRLMRAAGFDAEVLELPLARRDLFTSRESGRILLLGYDVSKHLPNALEGAAPERARREALCGLRNLVQAGGGLTRLAVAPDKRTIYAPWIAAPLPPKAIDLFALAREALGPAYLDFLGPLSAAAQAGVRDVYWPNDTHWGAAGHRIAGAAATEALTGGPAR